MLQQTSPECSSTQPVLRHLRDGEAPLGGGCWSASLPVLCYAVLGCAVLCYAVLCCAVLCCAVLCCAVLCFASTLTPPLPPFPPWLCVHCHDWCGPYPAECSTEYYAVKVHQPAAMQISVFAAHSVCLVINFLSQMQVPTGYCTWPVGWAKQAFTGACLLSWDHFEFCQL